MAGDVYGVGKTTLLRLLAGLAAPTAGQAVVLGGPPRQDSAYLAEIGFLTREIPLDRPAAAPSGGDPGCAAGVAGRAAYQVGDRRRPVVGPQAGHAGSGAQARRLTGCGGQHSSNTSPAPGGVQHAYNTDETALPGTRWHTC